VTDKNDEAISKRRTKTIKVLESPIRPSQHDVLKELLFLTIQENSDTQKKIANAPFLANGTAFLFLATAIVAGKIPDGITHVLLLSLWLFLVGLILGFVKLIFTAIINLNGIKEIGEDLGASLQLLRLYDLIHYEFAEEPVVLQGDNLTKYKADIDEIIDSLPDQKSVDLSTQVKPAFYIVIISLGCFLAGLIVPLVAISLQYQFFWQ